MDVYVAPWGEAGGDRRHLGSVSGPDGDLSRPPELRLQVRALNESGTLAACKMPPEIIIKCRPIYRSDPCAPENSS